MTDTYELTRPKARVQITTWRSGWEGVHVKEEGVKAGTREYA